MIQFRAISQPVDRHRFLESWETVFDRVWPIEVYRWLFNNNNHIYCAFDGNKVVAGYCLLKIQAYFDKVIKQGVLCNNVFVNGFKYQKLGIFQEITAFALEDAAQHYDFALGFPNQKAIRAHLRCGWQQEKSIPFLEYHVQQAEKHDSDYFAIQWFTSKDKPVSQTIINQFERLKNNYSFCLYKDYEFLQWRFFDNPRCDYQIGLISQDNKITDFFVCKYFQPRHRIHIVDHAFSSKNAIDYAIKNILDYYKVNTKDLVIDAWVSANEVQLFLDSGFLDVGNATHLIYYDLKKASTTIGHTPHLTLADNDVY